MQLRQLTSADVLQICRNIKNLGCDETAQRVKTLIGQVYSFAIAAGYAESNPTAALQVALKSKRHKHYATLTNPSEIAILMRAMKAYPHRLSSYPASLDYADILNTCVPEVFDTA